MPTNRRDFVKASAALAAITGARAAFGQPVTGFLPNPPSDSIVDDLALEALNAAQAAGASYADARIGRYRRQFVATREHNVTGVNDSESYGIGVSSSLPGILGVRRHEHDDQGRNWESGAGSGAVGESRTVGAAASRGAGAGHCRQGNVADARRRAIRSMSRSKRKSPCFWPQTKRR